MRGGGGGELPAAYTGYSIIDAALINAQIWFHISQTHSPFL